MGSSGSEGRETGKEGEYTKGEGREKGFIFPHGAMQSVIWSYDFVDKFVLHR